VKTRFPKFGKAADDRKHVSPTIPARSAVTVAYDDKIRGSDLRSKTFF
jgi:hypothetical protein